MDDLMIDMNGLGDGLDIEGDDIRCENIGEKDVSDEEIDAENLERRMSKVRIKEKQKIHRFTSPSVQIPTTELNNSSNLPPNMLLYPSVHKFEYRPQPLGLTNRHEMNVVNHGPQSSEFHNLVPYHQIYTPIEVHQPVNEFQMRPEYSGAMVPESQPRDNENMNAGIHHLEKDEFHNEHERPVDPQFESSINSLSLDYGGFNSPFNLGLDGTTTLDTDLDFLLDDDLIQYIGA